MRRGREEEEEEGLWVREKKRAGEGLGGVEREREREREREEGCFLEFCFSFETVSCLFCVCVSMCGWRRRVGVVESDL